MIIQHSYILALKYNIGKAVFIELIFRNIVYNRKSDTLWVHSVAMGVTGAVRAIEVRGGCTVRHMAG